MSCASLLKNKAKKGLYNFNKNGKSGFLVAFHGVFPGFFCDKGNKVWRISSVCMFRVPWT